MKILAVCGFGCGSSMILKMSIDKALKEMGKDVETEVSDVSSAKGARCDAIFTSSELADNLRSSVKVPVFEIKKYLDIAEIKGELEKFFAQKGG